MAYADPEGRFEYGGLRPGTYTVLIRTDLFLPYEREVTLAEGERVWLDADLEPGGSIVVAVRTTSGEAVPGAQVRYHAPPAERVTTDSEGEARIAGLAPGEYSVSAYHSLYRAETEEYAADVALGQVTRVEVTMEPAGFLEAAFRGLEPERDEWFAVRLTEVRRREPHRETNPRRPYSVQGALDGRQGVLTGYIPAVPAGRYEIDVIPGDSPDPTETWDQMRERSVFRAQVEIRAGEVRRQDYDVRLRY
jgi:hypothetical protein